MNLAVVAALSGCATSKSTYLPDGSLGHSIDCSGTANTWGTCEEKAGELCKERGYEVVSKAGDQGGMVTASQTGLFGGSIIKRSMLIKCK